MQEAFCWQQSFCAGILKGGTALAQTSETQTGETQAEQEVPKVTGQIYSCKITEDKQNVEIRFSEGDISGTDGKVYVFEQKPYEEELGNRKDYIASSQVGSLQANPVSLYLGTEKDRLYSKFIVLAVYDGTAFQPVSEPHYITNPEIVAKKIRQSLRTR